MQGLSRTEGPSLSSTASAAPGQGTETSTLSLWPLFLASWAFQKEGHLESRGSQQHESWLAERGHSRRHLSTFPVTKRFVTWHPQKPGVQR
jgi:hypothetical protein